MLELYQLEECPYCTKVRKKLSELGIDYILRNVPEDNDKRTYLKRLSGQDSVPTLIDSDTQRILAGDDQPIIQYLEEQYIRKSQ